MANVNKLVVSIHLGNREQEVGELVQSGNKIFFKYFTDFIHSGLEISPFKLPLSDKLYTIDHLPFEGLFGVFSDSLPDGWGRLLLDRKLSSLGISIDEISALDRLAYVGTKGMGALIYKPIIETPSSHHDIQLDTLAAETFTVLKGSPSDIIETLYDLGGSSGGARPKILAGYNPEKNHLIHGTDELPESYSHWIIKFPSFADAPDIANIEFAYAKMAVAAGIEMAECKLFEGASKKHYFGTKRFDRVDNQRLHLHSAAGLMHDNFRLSNLDYGNLMDAAFKLEKDVKAYEKIIRLAAFNVFAHNKDDHSKNFSFLMDAEGKWKFAPAYDLTFSNAAHGMQSMMVAGESKPGKSHLLELGKYFNVKNTKEIIDQVQDVLANWKSYAVQCGVEKQSANLIQRALGKLPQKK